MSLSILEFEQDVSSQVECFICGHTFESLPPVKAASEEGYEGYVCPRCLHLQEAAAQKLLMNRAESLRTRAEHLQRLAEGDIDLPREDLCLCKVTVQP